MKQGFPIKTWRYEPIYGDMLECNRILSAFGLTWCANGPDAGEQVAVMQRLCLPGMENEHYPSLSKQSVV